MKMAEKSRRELATVILDSRSSFQVAGLFGENGGIIVQMPGNIDPIDYRILSQVGSKIWLQS